MTVVAATAVSMETLILRVYEPRSSISLDFTATLCTRLEKMYVEANMLQMSVQIQFKEYPPASGGYASRLMIRQIHTGSLLVELAQDAIAPGGALTIWILVHALKHGPEKLYEWARLPNDLRTEWYQSRLKMQEAKQEAEANSNAKRSIFRKPKHPAPPSKSTQAFDQSEEDRKTLVEGTPYSVSYVKIVNSEIIKLEESANVIRRLSADLEVDVLEENGSQAKDPFLAS